MLFLTSKFDFPMNARCYMEVEFPSLSSSCELCKSTYTPCESFPVDLEVFLELYAMPVVLSCWCKKKGGLIVGMILLCRTYSHVRNLAMPKPLIMDNVSCLCICF